MVQFQFSGLHFAAQMAMPVTISPIAEQINSHLRHHLCGKFGFSTPTSDGRTEGRGESMAHSCPK
jgi:hypothetical protein